MKRVIKKMLFVLLALYLALLLYAIFLSDGVIFQPHRSSYGDTPDVVKLTTQSGKKISALYLPNFGARYTLLVSHGNAEDIGDDRFWLENLRLLGFGVLAYDYEGYGTSEGSPSERAVYEDESAAYDFLTDNLKMQPDNIIIFGRSVGSGPAVRLAARRPAAGLILQSPFVSAFRVLTRIPLLPFDKFPNYKEIRHVHCPVLIIHGEADTVIGPWHGRKLYDLANDPKKFVPVEGADHNDLEIVAKETYGNTLRQFAGFVYQHQQGKAAGAVF
jgi:fermentation-respiration switch protein FrsA (DUF1100 family)